MPPAVPRRRLGGRLRGGRRAGGRLGRHLLHLRSAADPGRLQALPFATIVTKDYGEFDNASNLDRLGVFRLNIGLGRKTYGSLFEAGAEHDFTALDQPMSHPVYGTYHWVCVLNPSEATFETLKPMLQEAYDRAVERYPRPA